MGCLFGKPDAEDVPKAIENDVTHRKSRVKSNRFIVEDKKRKAKSVRLRKNVDKVDRARKAKSVKLSSKRTRTRSRAKTADASLPKYVFFSLSFLSLYTVRNTHIFHETQMFCVRTTVQRDVRFRKTCDNTTTRHVQEENACFLFQGACADLCELRS